ncbi:TonB-dependent siderophore receptor [soil metagenome]
MTPGIRDLIPGAGMGFVLLHRWRAPVCAAILSLAASITDAAPADDRRDDDDAELETLTVIESPRNDAGPVLPTSTSLDSIFGNDTTVLEAPRAVSVLTSELIEQANIEDIQSITRLAPNTFSPNVFGVTSLPTIRGDLGELFQNGLRRTGGNNGFGFPTSFNAVESLQIVKGPPPVLLGSTQRVGGYVNLITKQPHFDTFRADGGLTTGRFDRYRGRLDLGGPLHEQRLGYRLSAEVVDDGSYYDFARTRSQSVYLALGLRPSDTLRYDFNVEYFDADVYPDIAGINRPTQALIDDGTYITGTGVSPDPRFGEIPGPGAVIAPTGEVRIPFNRVLNDPADVSEADHLIVNLTAEWQIGGEARLTNRFAYQTLSKFEAEQNSFVEIVDEARSFELRSELAHAYELGSIRNEAIAGVSLRRNHVVGFSQFTTEADNPIDLTASIESRRIPLPPEIQSQLVLLEPAGVLVSPGANYDRDGDGVGDFRISDTTGSDSDQYGVFYQDDLQLTNRWSLLLGLRGDWYQVSAQDPLPPPGFAAASDSTSAFNPAATGSVSYRPGSNSTWYFTYNYSQATINSLAGGFTLDGDGRIPDERFDTESELYELGAKFSLLDDELFLALAAFEQTRNLRNRDGSVSGIRTRGAELEMVWQPGRMFASLGLSWLDARFDGSSAVQGTRAVVDAFDGSRPDLIRGTGIGSPNFTVFPPGNDRVPGLPSWLLNAFAGYTLDSGLGGNLGLVATDGYKLDFLDQVRIRAQYTLNGSAFFRRGPWEIRADLFNITDQDNFSPVFGGFFGATLVFPELPFNYLVSFTYSLGG